MNDNYKEVLYCVWCKDCKNVDLKDNEEPCNECLSEPARQYSHKPVNFEPKD